MNESDFLKGMAVLASAYPDVEVKADTAAIYRELLGHLEPQDFERAIKTHICKNKWFPKVSELLHAATPIGPTPISVWNQLMAAAETGAKPEINYVAQRALDFIGGWEKFQYTPYDDLRFMFKNFKEAYLEAQDQEASSKALVGGAPLPQLGDK